MKNIFPKHPIQKQQLHGFSYMLKFKEIEDLGRKIIPLRKRNEATELCPSLTQAKGATIAPVDVSISLKATTCSDFKLKQAPRTLVLRCRVLLENSYDCHLNSYRGLYNQLRTALFVKPPSAPTIRVTTESDQLKIPRGSIIGY